MSESDKQAIAEAVEKVRSSSRQSMKDAVLAELRFTEHKLNNGWCDGNADFHRGYITAIKDTIAYVEILK